MDRTRRHTPNDKDVTPLDDEPTTSHAERIKSERPQFPPAPDGSIEVFRSSTGIRVLKDAGKRWTAVQFTDERVPTRPEKDALEAVLEEEPDKHAYRYEDPHGTKLWKRYSDGDHGGNVVDTIRFATALAEGRNAGKGMVV